MLLQALLFARSLFPDVRSDRFSSAPVCLDVKRNLLPFGETAYSRALERAYENVVPAIVRLNEAVTFPAVVKLHCSRWHLSPSFF
jgi:hypothetical protein